MALDPCPHCGKRFEHDNKGARAQHVSSCKREKEKFVDGDDGGSADAEQRPTTVERAEQHPARPPARSDSPSQEQAVQAGATLGGMVVDGAGGSPEEQADATSKLATALGGLVANAGQKYAAQQKEGAQRSRNASDDDIERVNEYVTCPECETQVTNLPEPGSEFGCPRCGARLRYDPS